MADQTDPKSEDLGKQLAEQMQSKLDTDEAHRLATETDDQYDAQVLAALEPKLKAAALGFNDIAKAADQLSVEKGKSMLQLYKANLPVFAAKISHRQLHIVPAMQNTPAQSYSITGGPDEFTFSGKSQPDFLKELLTMAASGSTGLK
jgi:hypothetical protein